MAKPLSANRTSRWKNPFDSITRAGQTPLFGCGRQSAELMVAELYAISAPIIPSISAPPSCAAKLYSPKVNQSGGSATEMWLKVRLPAVPAHPRPLPPHSASFRPFWLTFFLILPLLAHFAHFRPFSPRNFGLFSSPCALLFDHLEKEAA